MAGVERLEENQLIQVTSWRLPGELKITTGINGSAETYTISFSNGLDPRLLVLDEPEILGLVDAVQGHKEELLKGPERVGTRRLWLCQYTTKELTRIIESRKVL